MCGAEKELCAKTRHQISHDTRPAAESDLNVTLLPASVPLRRRWLKFELERTTTSGTGHCNNLIMARRTRLEHGCLLIHTHTPIPDGAKGLNCTVEMGLNCLGKSMDTSRDSRNAIHRLLFAPRQERWRHGDVLPLPKAHHAQPPG